MTDRVHIYKKMVPAEIWEWLLAAVGAINEKNDQRLFIVLMVDSDTNKELARKMKEYAI